MCMRCVYDAASQRLLATAERTHGVYASKDGGNTWQLSPDTGVSIRVAMNFQGHLLAASSYNGLLLQQGAASSSETASAAGANSGNSGRQ